jgi:hypothetical protein
MGSLSCLLTQVLRLLKAFSTSRRSPTLCEPGVKKTGGFSAASTMTRAPTKPAMTRTPPQHKIRPLLPSTTFVTLVQSQRIQSQRRGWGWKPRKESSASLVTG